MTLRLLTTIMSIAFTLIIFTGSESTSENVSGTSDVFLMCDFQGLVADCEVYGIENDTSGLKVFKVVPENENSSTKFLTITGFGYSSIPQEIGEKFPNLESFRIRKTAVKAVGSGDFKSMQDLRHLSLDSNRISIIYQEALYNLPELESFYISNNKIEFLHPDLFKNSPKLKSLIADYNLVKILDARLFKSNPKLEWISLTYNRVNNVRVNFMEFKNLLYVNLKKNEGKCDVIFDEQTTEPEERVQKIAEFQQKVEQNCRI